MIGVIGIGLRCLAFGGAHLDPYHLTGTFRVTHLHLQMAYFGSKHKVGINGLIGLRVKN
jgi:hypothetical protein